MCCLSIVINKAVYYIMNYILSSNSVHITHITDIILVVLLQWKLVKFAIGVISRINMYLVVKYIIKMCSKYATHKSVSSPDLESEILTMANGIINKLKSMGSIGITFTSSDVVTGGKRIKGRPIYNE